MEKMGNEKVTLDEWENLNEMEKKNEILKTETKREKSLRKTNSWREWRPPATTPNNENPRDRDETINEEEDRNLDEIETN